MAQPQIDSILAAIKKLSQQSWVDRVLQAEIPLIQSDTEARLSDIRFKTPASKGDADFGYDTGNFANSWLNSIKFANGEIARSTDVDYAEDLQAIAEDKSIYADGYLGYSDNLIDLILNSIGDRAEEIWVQT